MVRPDDPVTNLLPLGPDATGDAVRDLQTRLHRVGFPSARTGVYDAATCDAVRAFQRRSGLDATGHCDHPTWAAIVESGYSLGDRLLYHRSPMLRGDDIAVLQRRLSELGFHSGRVDGIFGPDTEEAVTAFQRNTALVTDGVAGPDVIAQLRRLGPGKGSVTKALLTERLALLDASHELQDARIAIAEPGTLPVIAHNITAELDAAGAMTLAIHHPDGSVGAAEANTFDAQCFLGCTSRHEPGAKLSYYRTEGFESAGGRHLAEVVRTHLIATALPGPVETVGMRLPVLRETRMPALWCEIGPTTWVVEHAMMLATALADAVRSWVAEPVEDSPDEHPPTAS